MSNHLKHIAIKNHYYSGKRFGRAYTSNFYQDVQNAENGFIFIQAACTKSGIEPGRIAVIKIKSIWKTN